LLPALFTAGLATRALLILLATLALRVLLALLAARAVLLAAHAVLALLALFVLHLVSFRSLVVPRVRLHASCKRHATPSRRLDGRFPPRTAP
jgi:hypothetical protein